MKNKGNFFKKIPWIWLVAYLPLILLLYYVVNNYFHERTSTPQICNEEKCFTVEIARTSAEQQKGLMEREQMDTDKGMLFIFSNMAVHNFRMKNTLIPLDMIWIDDQLNVVKILTAEPCTADPCPLYQPGIPAKYVLEINAGMSEKHEIIEGTKMKFVNIQ